MEYIYLNQEEIIQLNKDLMPKRTNRFSSADISSLLTLVSPEVKKAVNNKIGVIFENNIRKTLEIEYDWKIQIFQGNFFIEKLYLKEKPILFIRINMLQEKISFLNLIQKLKIALLLIKMII